MRRILILTNDKNNAVTLRTLLEKYRIEFEIAIGDETGRTILTERFMNLILLDAAAIKGGTSWIFPFLESRRLRIPIIVVGAGEGALTVPPANQGDVRFLPQPLEPEAIVAAIDAVDRESRKITLERVNAAPLAPLGSFSDD